MIDLINFIIFCLISIFVFSAGFYGVFIELTKRGYIQTEDFIIGFLLIIVGIYGVYISLKYILQVE
jgi:hypothetical protein